MMTKAFAPVLVFLAGVGTASVAIGPEGQTPEGAKLSVATRTTISPRPATAWQDLQRPAPLEPPEPEQSTTAALSPWLPLPPETNARPLDRVSLTRALQRELKRVGCYHGEINGEWTDSTRRAMKRFTDQANAKLPVGEPDQVLLSLVQGDLDRGCNERCRQRPTGPDSCPGPGVTANALPNNKTAATIAAPTSPPLKPPMALAGPKATATHGENPARELTPRRRVAASSQYRGIDSSARDEHWTVKLWKNSTY